jgi:uncharacterized membrane protein
MKNKNISEQQHNNHPLSSSNPTSATRSNQVAIITSPLPNPDFLLAYDKVRPGLSEEVIQMIKEQNAHRRQLENKQMDCNIEHVKNVDKDFKRGQWFGLILGALALASGTTVAILGHDIPGTVLGALGIGSIVYAFVKGRNSQ